MEVEREETTVATMDTVRWVATPVLYRTRVVGNLI